ncbi:MAG: lysoplasmalogenase [Bradymonadia bacterium]
MTTLIIIYAILVGALTVLDQRLSLWLKGVIKMTAASCFIGLPIVCFEHLNTFTLLIFTGLCASWLGDLCLVWPGTGRHFKLGIFAFLLAHFAYAGAFLTQPLALQLTLPLLALFLLLGFGVYFKLMPDIPTKLRPPVVVYIIALVAMTALAWTLDASDARFTYGLAATAFLLSDISVALQRFGTHSQIHRLWGVPLYFGAQIAFAYLITNQSCGISL